MCHLLGPRDVAHVQQPIDPFLNLHECTVVRQVAHNASHDRSDRVALGDLRPRVGQRLFDAQGDLLRIGIHAEHHHVHVPVKIDDLARMAHTACPTHLADVHHAFYAFLEFDEGAVVGHADDPPAHNVSDEIPVGRRLPRVVGLLFQAEAYAFSLRVEVEDHDVDLLADRHRLRGMLDAPPRHVRDVQQTVDAADVDKGSEIGDILDFAREDLAHFDGRQQMTLLVSPLFFEHPPAADHHVAAPLAELDDLDLHGLADVPVEITRGAPRQLARRHERVHADVDLQAPFDAPHDAALDCAVFFIHLLNVGPVLDAICFGFRENRHPVLVFGLFNKHIELIAHLDCRRVRKLCNAHDAFTLVPNVNEHPVWTDFHNRAADHFAFGEILHRLSIQRLHLLHRHLLGIPGFLVGLSKVQRHAEF